MRKILFLLLVLIGSASNAQTLQYRFASSGSFHNEIGTACSAWSSSFNATGGSCQSSVTKMATLQDQTCTISWSGSNCTSGTATRSPTLQCSDGSQPVDGLCGPPPPVPCVAGDTFEATFNRGPYASPNILPLPTAVNGCMVHVDEVLTCFTDGDSTDPMRPYFCRYKFVQTGESSTGGDGVPVTDEPVNKNPAAQQPYVPGSGQGCPKGTVNVGTDSHGDSLCAGVGTSPTPAKPPPTTTQPTQTTTNPDGSTSDVDTTVRENADGSTTTTTRTTTTNPDGSKRVTENTVTSKTPTGATGKADPSKEEQSDFCKQNPHLNACKNSTVSGACKEISCEGDAIQCRIAKEAAERNCKAKNDEDEVKAKGYYQIGADALNGTLPGLPSPDNPENIAVGSVDQNAGWLGAGSCFPDKTINFRGSAITISFTEICSYLVALRYALMIVALLLSFRMLSGTFLRD